MESAQVCPLFFDFMDQSRTVRAFIARLGKPLRQIPTLLVLPSAVVLMLVVLSLWNPLWMAHLTQRINQFIFDHFGNFYLWFGLLNLVMFPAIAVSPLGKVKLGGPHSQPEHSWFSWIAMLFCCGMGIGFMMWGAAEPLYHYMNPPLPGTEGDLQREAVAFSYTFLHWGLEPWAIYGATAMVIAFFSFNLKRGLSFSAFLIDPHEESSETPLEKLIRSTADFVMVIAIIFGIAATIATGVINVEGGLGSLTSLSGGTGMELSIIAVITAVYLFSAANGLDKGIKTLSNISVLLSFLLLAAMIWFGPELKIMRTLVEDVPNYLGHLLPMSLGLGEFREPNWLNEWTIRYWSWWIAWAPFVGLFIAIISRGRTIRELLVAVMITPSLFSLVWFTAFGQTAINLQESSQIVGDRFDWSGVPTLLFDVLGSYSDFPFLSWLSVFLIAIFICNSADSASYIMACFSRGKVLDEGSIRLQMIWGILFAALTLVLLLTGGSGEYDSLYVLQEITQIAALPFTLLLLLVFSRFVYKLYLHWKEQYTMSRPL